MKIDLDKANREFVEVEVTLGEEVHNLKFYAQNGKQKKAIRKLLKNKEAKVYEVEELAEEQFFQRLEGDETVINTIKDFYDENGDINDFMSECEKALGKQKKKA